jgi:lipopolysaccharide export system ATP-binding protein
MNTLSAEGIHRSFNGRSVVKGVSLSLKSGEIMGLLGPNGAGKTTTFYIIAGLLQPDAGCIQLQQKDITKKSLDQRAHLGLGYLPQEPSIFRQLTVHQNILAVLELNRNCPRSERAERCEALLERFHLKHVRTLKGVSLSGGERRRVEIARALAMDPHFMLLDEPFAGIDPISVIDIKRIIMELAFKGIGILITDHNVRETLNFCHHAAIMNEGKIICTGTPQAIVHNQKVREVYLGEGFTL